MTSIANVPKGGIVHTQSTREEYEFQFRLHRMYQRWRQPGIVGICNIVWNALHSATGGHKHGVNSMFTCAQYSLIAREYPGESNSYVPINQGRFLGRNRKVAEQLKQHRSIFCKPVRDDEADFS